MKSIHIVADENLLGLSSYLESIHNLSYTLDILPGRKIEAGHLKNADVLLVRSVTQVNERLLKNSRVRFVGSATTGLEHIDQNFLQASGIYFCSAFGANANAVAEYVMSCLAWVSKKENENYFEKQIGIVGYGNVGKALFAKLEVMGSPCKIYDPLLALQESAMSGMGFACWEEMLECDVLSFHVPYTQSGEFPTHRMINAEFLRCWKDGALLINAARGEICDEQALLPAIKNKNLKCVLDVWQNEPEISLPLLDAVLLASPHVAGYSLDAKLNASKFLVDELVNFLKDEGALLVANRINTEKAELKKIAQKDVISCMLAAYNPEHDSKDLKSRANQEIAQAFDAMRKHYQHRFEWKHFLVTQVLSGKDLQILEALGFSCE